MGNVWQRQHNENNSGDKQTVLMGPEEGNEICFDRQSITNGQHWLVKSYVGAAVWLPEK